MEIKDSGAAETAPTTGSTLPWAYQIDYKAGKTPQNYASDATPQKAGAKFYYYDKEMSEKVDFTLPATLIVCDILSGLSGTIEENGRYSNFYSNKVRDSRSEAMRLYMSGIDRPLLTGVYSAIKPTLPNGAHFQMYLLCLDVSSKKPFLLTLGATLSDQLKRAIAGRTNAKAEKVNLFGLCDISTKWWFIQMKGGFQKVTKEGTPYEGKGDLYFVPDMIAGVFHADSNPEVSAMCEEIRNTSSEYIQSTQDRIWKAETTAAASSAETPAPAVAAPPMSWPDAPKAVEPAPLGDDLPF
jgi:hypothetical protein